ncbi:MAG: CDP-alcohol phosphatidyltransferase family protein [Candidatus Saccharimonadales bacterium]
MKKIADSIKLAVRSVMRRIAKMLDTVTNHKITPNSVTWFGFAMHIPIAYLIATGSFVWAAVLLVIFGLFDTLDGELARLQNRVTNNGGFLDASTDRLKEVLLYAGAAYFLATTSEPRYAALAVIACGASLCVSYVKAKGEATVAGLDKKIPYATLNRMFSGGFFPFEVRMVVFIVGLLLNQLPWTLAVIGVCSIFTVFQRIIIISKALR